MKEHYPTCRLLLRIKPIGKDSVMQFSNKFGCDEMRAYDILSAAKNWNIPVIGISFHVGSKCFNPQMYHETMKVGKRIMEHGRNLGLDMKMVDIGGGFPGEDNSNVNFANFVKAIQVSINEIFDESYNFIAEPGRFYNAAIMELHLKVIGRR